MAIFVLRVLLFWYWNVDFLKRRVVILGQGPLADMVSNYVRKEGSSHFAASAASRRASRRRASTISLGNIVARARPFARPAPYAHMAESLHAEEIVVATDDRRGLPVEELLRCRLQGIQVTDYRDILGARGRSNRYRSSGRRLAGLRRGFPPEFRAPRGEACRRHRRQLDLLDGLIPADARRCGADQTGQPRAGFFHPRSGRL